MAKKKVQVQGAQIPRNTVERSASVAEGVCSYPTPQGRGMKRNTEIGLFAKPSLNYL